MPALPSVSPITMFSNSKRRWYKCFKKEGTCEAKNAEVYEVDEVDEI
jgi:hypothetical protein